MQKSIPYSACQKNLIKYNHLDALLALRGLACLMVVIIHCNPPRNSIIYKGYDLSWLTFSHGAVAVWIFFCLSGYLMAKAFYTERYTADVPGVINFWRNRAIRIFPLYYFAVVILSIFVYPDVLKIENWGYLIRVCTFTYHPHINFQHIAFNEVFWSLSTEIQFYILVPFIFNFLRYRLVSQKQVVLVSVFIIFVTLILKCIFWLSFRNEMTEHMEYAFKYWYTPLSNSLDLFLCGFFVNAFIKYQKPKLEKSEIISNAWKPNILPKGTTKYLAVILLILLYLFTAQHLYHQELWGLPSRPSGWRTSTTIFIFQPLTAIIISFFIFAFESDVYHDFTRNEKLSFGSILRNPLRILEVLGNLSYGVYIWHMPIISKILTIFTSNIPIEAFYTRLTATLLLSITLAVVTYYLVELPATRWKIYPKNYEL
ncbi:MAG: acyltransferase [Stigonema ocellatum SAG 48.90 = DSM 106950]|nr:acyltransferase [Stigonema ocellatum SAG 48.90 = DSM 106950]